MNMKNMNEPPMGDDALTRLLRAWTMVSPIPRHFAAEVWRRIARAEAGRPWAIWLLISGWLNRKLARPAWAVASILILMALGTVGGYVQAATRLAHEQERLGAFYVQAVDPYQRLQD